MKEVGFMVVAGLVSGILTRFMPSVPGLENMITLVGTLAAIAGGAIGVLFKRLSMGPFIGVTVASLALAVFSLVQFNSIVAGEPGSDAANWLYFWTSTLFLPIGIIIEVAGLKISE